LLPPPAYFPLNVKLNKKGYNSFNSILKKGLTALSSNDFQATARETGAVILDTRKPQDFANGFIPGSIFVGIDGGFAPWVGTLIPDIEHPILFVADKGREEEVITRLARVGYDNTIGYLEGGIESWYSADMEVDRIKSISADELASQFEQDKGITILDVRKPNEYQAEHLETASNKPLDSIYDHLGELPQEDTLFIHCAGGYRSMIAASIMKANGFTNLVDVKGGYNAITETNLPRTSFICPSTLV
jgi:hydroxyacylglutathione hydrolase